MDSEESEDGEALRSAVRDAAARGASLGAHAAAKSAT